MGLSFDAYPPNEVTYMVGEAGHKKGNMHPMKIFFSGVSAGCLLSFAPASAATMTTSTWLSENAPGPQRILGALVFPYGITMVTLTGVDLCTASFMYTTVAVLRRRLSWQKALLHWLITFWGNLAGALFTVCIVFGYGGVFSADPWRAALITSTTTRQVTPTWPMIFLRGVGCNWLVCLGCFFAIQARDLTSKVVGLYWPIFAFVSLGFDHVVANMFFIPMAIFVGHPEISVGLYIYKGIIPVLLGNIVGGGLFCGCFYYGLYLWRQPDVFSGIPPARKDDVEQGLQATGENQKGQVSSTDSDSDRNR